MRNKYTNEVVAKIVHDLASLPMDERANILVIVLQQISYRTKDDSRVTRKEAPIATNTKRDPEPGDVLKRLWGNALNDMNTVLALGKKDNPEKRSQRSKAAGKSAPKIP